MSHEELLAQTNWERTALGPQDGWAPSLRAAVRICLSSHFPMLAFGGADLLMIYNEGYAPMLGEKHPQAFGTPVRDVWPEIWDVIGPMFSQVVSTREATWSDDQLLILNRYGYDEARYFTYSFSPIVEHDGSVVGVFTAVTETTQRVVGERNLETLRNLAAAAASADAEDEAWRIAANVLLESNEDVAAAQLYRWNDERALPVASAGEDTIQFPGELSRAALERATVTEVVSGGGTVTLPLLLNGDVLVGALVVRIIPLRPIDSSYHDFLTMAAGHIASGIANARAHEDERRRLQELAVLDVKARNAEERYRAFVATSSEAIWRCELEKPMPIGQLDPDEQIAWMFEHGRMAECNDALAKQYGFESAGDLIGARLGDLLLPDNPENVLYLRAFIEAGYRLTDAESIEVNRSGERRHFLNNLTAIIEGGMVLRAWGTQRDITPVKQAQARLDFIARASEELNATLDYEDTLRALGRLAVEQLSECCVTYTTDGVTMRVAAVDCRTADTASVEEVAARALSEAGSSLFATGETRTTVCVAAPLEQYPAICEVAGALGATAVTMTPLRAHGRNIGAVALFSATPLAAEDLQLAEELARRGAAALDNAALFTAAQAANVAKDEFLATLSHELRTPMTATLGWAAMLRMEAVNPETFKVAIDALEQSTRSQANLIDDILDVSRISSGKMRANLAPVYLRSVLAHAVDTIWAPAEAKQIDIRIDVDGFEEPFLADGDRLQQVIWNLFSNAVKFTPRGGTVTLRASEENGMAVISVTDTGEGIAPEFLPSVFERFRQADSSASRRYGGLGLGLAIVKSLVEIHGGTVKAESAGVGTGATFTVTLPMNTPEIQAGSARVSPRNVTLENISVLIVDDEPATRLMLKTVLAHFSADVTVAESVTEALSTLEKEGKPHVVISDIAMPTEDGFALLRQLRDAGLTVPVIALTAQSSQADRQRALAAGFDAWLGKPIDPTVLAREILRLARH